MRLCNGERTTPVHEQIQTRRFFFRHLGYVAPEVVNDLINEVWESFLGARELIKNKWPEWSDIESVTSEDDPRSLLKKNIQCWAERYKIGESAFLRLEDTARDPATWMLSAVLEQMDFWREFPNTFQERWWGSCSWEYKRPLPYQDQFIALSSSHPNVYVYDMLMETREEAKNRMMQDLEAQLDAELDKLDAKAAERGYGSATEKSELVRHVEWFIRYRIQGWSVGEIATEYHRSRRTIYDGIQKMTELLAVVPQKKPSGRPRKATAQR